MISSAAARYQSRDLASERDPKASARPNTRCAYATQLRQWMAWADANGVPAFPADPIANYLAERGAAGQSSSTLRTVVAAVKAGHDANGLTFDTKAPAITRTLRGIRNTLPRLPRQAEPICGLDVLEILAAADASPIGRRDAALLALDYRPTAAENTRSAVAALTA